MGIRIDGASDLINATDGSLTIEGQSINSTGIGTFSGGVKVGSAATIHSTGQFNIGVAATIFASGNATFSGIATVASLVSSDNVEINHGTGQAHYQITQASGNTVKFGIVSGSNIELSGTSNNDMYFKTNNTERLRIGAGGGVGISTTLIRNQYFMNIAAPSQAYVPGTNLMDGGGVCFQGTDNSFEEGRTYPGIFWTGNTASLGRARAGILGISVANNDATDIAFLTRHMADGSTLTPTDEKMRLTTEGRVGLGTTSPEATRLHCWDGDSGGSTSSGSVVTIEKNDTATLQFLSPNNKYNAIRFGDNNDNGAGWIQYNHSDNSMQFGSNGSEEMRMLSGGGITFNGDTASANALDDYEEGSWTPVPENTNNTPTYHNQTGIYTKIGNLVTVIGFLQFNNAPTFTSNDSELRVTGLPFTANGIGYMNTVGNVTFQSLNWSGSTYNDYGAEGNLVCGVVENTKNVFKVNPDGNNLIRGTLRREAFEGGGIITWSMTYKTNS